MKLDVAVLADAANVSREGKLNICGIFRNIFGPQLPVIWPSLTMALQVTLDSSEKGRPHTLGLVFTDPKKRPMNQFPEMNFEVPADAQGSFFTLPFVLNLTNLAFPIHGVYEFALTLDGADAGTLSLEVALPPSAPVAAPPLPPSFTQPPSPIAEAG
jgi:hypothetical protein